jgi:indolepyruvate decarboxylase
MPVPGAASPATPAPATGTLTYKQAFERIGAALDNSWITIPDTFLGIYSAANLPTQGRDAFLCSAVWASLGHSVAAAVGASFGSNRRPLVICGDGGFHMTAQALSTMVRYKRNPVIVVIDNGIYGYEQFLLDASFFSSPAKPPRPYVVLNEWDYAGIAKGFGLPFFRAVNTAALLDAALADVKAVSGAAMIVAQVNPHDLPAELA